MFKKRTVTVTVGPKNEEPTPETPVDPDAFKKNATFVLHKLERTGVKVFAGVVIFVLLDTHRQVAVAKANNPVPPS